MVCSLVILRWLLLTTSGMDDVLPKPFTRKSLLDMLEKHLVHLKTLTPAMEAPPTAAAVSMAAQNSAPHSVKEESSPGQSPAASMSNWQSPAQFQGMTTIHPTVQNVQTQYVPATPVTAAYVDQNGIQYPANQAALNMAAARPQHRRQISGMSGVQDGGSMAKRQRIYAPQPQLMVNPVQATRSG